jgi:hypothetical protein
MSAPLRSYVSLEYRAKEQGYADAHTMVAYALARGGNVLKAAEIIGCPHATLVKWLAKHKYTVGKIAVLLKAS